MWWIVVIIGCCGLYLYSLYGIYVFVLCDIIVYGYFLGVRISEIINRVILF